MTTDDVMEKLMAMARRNGCVVLGEDAALQVSRCNHCLGVMVFAGSINPGANPAGLHISSEQALALAQAFIESKEVDGVGRDIGRWHVRAKPEGRLTFDVFSDEIDATEQHASIVLGKKAAEQVGRTLMTLSVGEAQKEG